MRDKGALVQGYNGQLAVDSEHQIIVAAELSNQAPDVEYFIPMLDQVLVNCEQIPDAALADAGYSSDANVRRVSARRVDVYIAPARIPHGEKKPPLDGKSTARAMKEAMRAKLNTDIGDALYRRRKAIVEPVNGQLKNRGLGALSLRGLHKARGEWSLIALTHNLLKLHRLAALNGRSRWALRPPPAPFFQPCKSSPPASVPTSAPHGQHRCLRQRSPSTF